MSKIIENKKVPISVLQGWEKNPRSLDKKSYDRLKKQVQSLGVYVPLVVNEDMVVLSGNMRLKVFQELKIDPVWVTIVEAKDEKTMLEYALSANDRAGEYDEQQLAELLVNTPGINLEDFHVDLGKNISLEEILSNFGPDNIDHGGLSRRFLVPPFSILDSRLGEWQDRKMAWINTGLKSELGRDENLMKTPDRLPGQSGTNAHVAPDTSIFDPVLCEIVYYWFGFLGASVLDPFAGGSVRGIIANKLGLTYIGIDLRKEQIEENKVQGKKFNTQAQWIEGDSNVLLDTIDDNSIDLVFSCPPYEDLEVYSDDPKDISTMDHVAFNIIYRSIIKKSCTKLKEDRFAIFVVGDVRNKKGFYKLLVPNTIKFFEENNVHLYNEIILINANGTAGMRASHQFQPKRKVVKTHQNVLVFYKGNPENIKKNYGTIEIVELPIE